MNVEYLNYSRETDHLISQTQPRPTSRIDLGTMLRLDGFEKTTPDPDPDPDGRNDAVAQQFTEMRRELHQNAERIQALGSEVADLREVVTRLMLQPAIGGTFPAITEIEKIVVQVFHRDNLTEANIKAGFTVWSLKIEFWHRNKKQSGIDIALFAPKHVLAILRGKKAPPAIIDRIARLDSSRGLCGIVRRKLTGGGRGYEVTQVAILGDHECGPDQIVMGLFIGDDEIAIDGFKPANGTKAGRALFVANWRRQIREMRA